MYVRMYVLYTVFMGQLINRSDMQHFTVNFTTKMWWSGSVK